MSLYRHLHKDICRNFNVKPLNGDIYFSLDQSVSAPDKHFHA